MRLFEGMKNENGVLSIGGVKLTDLYDKYKQALYVYDEQLLEDTCKLFTENFKSSNFETEILYASKAFSCLEIYRLISKFNLGTDAVSQGEMFTAKQAGFDMKKVYFHGNNKTYEELAAALDYGVSNIIIDNDYEYHFINDLAKEREVQVNILLRINTGIDAHTHEYIKTSKDDSKFGYSVYDEKIYDLIYDMSNQSNLNFLGFHSHIGSQIFEEESFFEATKTVFNFSKKVQEKVKIDIKVLNLGGGFGVYYTKNDKPMELVSFLNRYIKVIEDERNTSGLNIEKIIIEPGRSLICNAGSTLYEIGGTKKTYAGREYIFVDGGMGDNPRYALYKAEYECCIVNKINKENIREYTIAGKYCESGDIIIKNVNLAQAERGDLLLVTSTGAYNHSMASNYNKMRKLGVVFLKDGKDRLVVKADTLEDLIKNDI
ncbi:diaminopimelate decarboxylase [Gemella sp. 19428wG2_WT2a]|nr:diaminopimelate decarboxylase [Gemella sp. 19428wG2_WT2a]TFU60390.1 diaminopimelate decarboxylase [Gemella sp. WT2a]